MECSHLHTRPVGPGHQIIKHTKQVLALSALTVAHIRSVSHPAHRDPSKPHQIPQTYRIRLTTRLGGSALSCPPRGSEGRVRHPENKELGPGTAAPDPPRFVAASSTSGSFRLEPGPPLSASGTHPASKMRAPEGGLGARVRGREEAEGPGASAEVVPAA
eukprot:273563-Rhodomonas_salina.1